MELQEIELASRGIAFGGVLSNRAICSNFETMPGVQKKYFQMPLAREQPIIITYSSEIDLPHHQPRPNLDLLV